jgi:LPXTG-motif cell wall-anchored protein
MLRRLISTIAITAVAILSPAAVASADDEYGPGEFPCMITFDSQIVTVGEPLGMTVQCDGMAGETVDVQVSFAGQAAASDSPVDVAGTESTALTLDQDGAATDTVTLSAPGDYTVRVLDSDGEPLSMVYTITATAVAGGGDGGGTGAGGGGGLAATGSTSMPYLAIAGGLLVLGALALVASRVRARRG